MNLNDAKISLKNQTDTKRHQLYVKTQLFNQPRTPSHNGFRKRRASPPLNATSSCITPNLFGSLLETIWRQNSRSTWHVGANKMNVYNLKNVSSEHGDGEVGSPQ